ncbi:MAG: HEAT repeat domain-containing protein [Phototrophicaceae bacterium]
MDDFTSPEKRAVTVEQLLEHLAKEHIEFNTILTYGLSDLSQDTLNRIRPSWVLLDTDTKITIIRHLTDVAESNIELHYDTFGWLVLEDRESDILEAGLDLLWENESLSLMNRLIEFCNDSYPNNLRVTAVRHLERFIALGEYGEIDGDSFKRALGSLQAIWYSDNQDVQLRGACIECLGNATFEELPKLIEEAYSSASDEIRCSAVYAMGRTCDETWEDILLDELNSRDAQMRYEAARSCGHIESTEALPILYQMVIDDEREIQEISIWSMGEIGGRYAQNYLEDLAEKFEDDDELSVLIKDAIGMASMFDNDLDF